MQKTERGRDLPTSITALQIPVVVCDSWFGQSIVRPFQLLQSCNTALIQRNQSSYHVSNIHQAERYTLRLPPSLVLAESKRLGEAKRQ